MLWNFTGVVQKIQILMWENFCLVWSSTALSKGRSNLYYWDRQQTQGKCLFKVNVNSKDSNQWHEQFHILLIIQVGSFIFWESSILYVKVYMGSLTSFTGHIWMNLFASFIVHNCIIFHVFLLSEAVYYILGQQFWALQMLYK